MDIFDLDPGENQVAFAAIAVIRDRKPLQNPYTDLWDALAPWRTIDRHSPSTHRWRFDRMNTSKLLGATMVAGALAAGGAFAGISSASAASNGSSSANTTGATAQ
jgi:hypothetical protein